MFNKMLFNKSPFNRIFIVLEDGTVIELLGQPNQFSSLTGNYIYLYNLYGNKLNVMLEGNINKLEELLGQYIQGDDLDGKG